MSKMRYLFPADYMADPSAHVFNNRLYIYPSHDRDSGEAFDDDGQIYCYFGGLWGGQLQRYRDNIALKAEQLPEGAEPALPSRVARMTDDVLQFAEAPRPVVILDDEGQPLRADDPHRFFEASWMHKQDGRYYFSYSTGDSHLLCLAVGDSLYGPFRFCRELLQPVVGWTTHHSIVQYNGEWNLFHHDCVPSGGVTWLRSLKVSCLSSLGA